MSKYICTLFLSLIITFLTLAVLISTIFYVGVLFVFLIIVTFIIFKTVKFTSLQNWEVASESVEVNIEDGISRLSSAIRFKTISYKERELIDKREFKAFLEFLREAFPRVHSSLDVQIINDFSIILKWDGNNSLLKPVLSLAHYDVVPADTDNGQAWEYPPFDGIIKEGFVWGRGTIDDKSCLMAMLEAAEELLKNGFIPERTIFFAFGHDEEIGGQNGAERIAEYFKSEGISFEYAIDEGLMITDGMIPNVSKPVALIGIAEKGYTSIELTAFSNSGHSSMPPRDTCIGILSKAICKIEKKQFHGSINKVVTSLFRYISPEMPFIFKILFANLWLTAPLIKLILASKNSTNALIRTTIAPTMLKAGIKDNILPNEASAVINLRVIPGEDNDSVLKHIKKALGTLPIRFKVLEHAKFNPSSISRLNNYSFKLIQLAIRKVFPDVVIAPSMALAGSDSRYYSCICNDIYRFVPIMINKEDTGRIHGCNERISIENYRQMIKFYIQLLRGTI